MLAGRGGVIERELELFFVGVVTDAAGGPAVLSQLEQTKCQVVICRKTDIIRGRLQGKVTASLC